MFSETIQLSLGKLYNILLGNHTKNLRGNKIGEPRLPPLQGDL